MVQALSPGFIGQNAACVDNFNKKTKYETGKNTFFLSSFVHF
jgi:hypothetical protein